MKKCTFILALVFLLSLIIGANPALALSPPAYEGFNSVDALIHWIENVEVEATDAWGNFYPFLSEVRQQGSVLTIDAKTNEYVLEYISISSSSRMMEYSFHEKSNKENCIVLYINLPVANSTALLLDEEMQKANYEKSSVTIGGETITLYHKNGGEYIKADGTKGQFATSAEFELMGHRVSMYVDGNLRDKPWDNSYLDLFAFNLVKLNGKFIPRFSDVADGQWYAEAVNYLAERDIVNGISERVFSPHSGATRAQLVKILCELYNIAPMSGGDNFADAYGPNGEALWHTGYLAAAKKAGIIEGVGGNSFNPNGALTRQELFTMLHRVLKEREALPKGTGRAVGTFDDHESIADWAAEAMAYFTENGIVEGYENKLNPLAPATRAEMSQVLYNIIAA